jgi:hypothetical protein
MTYELDMNDMNGNMNDMNGNMNDINGDMMWHE